MSDVGGLPDLGAFVDSDGGGGGERPYLVIDTGANPDEVMKRRGYSIPIMPGKEEPPSLKRDRSPHPAPKEKTTHNFKCTLELAQHLLDLVDKRADASDKVEELAQKKEDAEDKRLDIERDMYNAALALAPAIVASRNVTSSDADKAVFQAVTNVYRTDADWHVEDDEEEDSDEEEYRKSKITIVFWGNETTHNAGSGPQQPGKKTLYVHIIKGQFVRACFSQGEVVYAWIKTGLGGTGEWEGPVLEKHAPILGEIARLHDGLVWFAVQVLAFMKMNDRAWRGKSDKTRIFWRDHIIPKLQAVERAHDAGMNNGHADEEEEDDDEEEPPKRSKSGRKPKKTAAAGPTEMSQARRPPKKTTTRGGGRKKK
jgi:hypothetical protein